MKRIYLSPPHMSGRELNLVRDAFESNWIAPLGPHVDEFEREFCKVVRVPHAVALSSGTAALHLALRIIADRAGHRAAVPGRRSAESPEVICSTFTFSASANPIVYEGYRPAFIDCDPETWQMDPGLLREELKGRARYGRLPLAVIVVDLYGQCADYDSILPACAEFDVPVIEDAAEALGATYSGRQETEGRRSKTGEVARRPSEPQVRFPVNGPRSAGTLGNVGVFSFNGNKIITTSGGGMLVSRDKAVVDKARFLATQARDPAPHYQHSEIGFNYRLSNVLAAVGRGQLAVLAQRIAARRRNFEFYRKNLGGLPGLAFMPEAVYGRSTRWLTCLTIDPEEHGASREDVRLALDRENIEARPLWKPLHLQPVFEGCRVRGGGTSERLYERGLCLPSGSALVREDLERICTVVKR